MGLDLEQEAAPAPATPAPAPRPFDASPSIAALAKALTLAQVQITFAAKASVNPHFGSRYADLAGVWEALRAPLTSQGLSVVQLAGQRELVTVLMHTSGEWISSTTPILGAEKGSQAYGSGLTYARRYALAAIAGIAQDDDDGESSEGRSVPAAGNGGAKSQQPVVTPAQQEDAKAFEVLLREAGSTDELVAVGKQIGKAKLPAPILTVLRRIASEQRKAIEAAPREPGEEG